MSTALLFAHDAGGAEHLSLWAAKNIANVYAAIQGPAVSIFKKNLKNFTQVSVDEAFALPYDIFTSTSWESDLEKRAIKWANEQGRGCISVVDHWVNYRERFLIEGQEILPDEIWVTDQYAYEIAQETFAGQAVKLIENLYLEKLKHQYRSFAKEDLSQASLRESRTALYICEPINKHSLKAVGNTASLSGYTEEEAFDYFLQNIFSVAPKVENITVRLHPSQWGRMEEYEWMRYASNAFDISMSAHTDLCSDLAGAQLVVGMESMALAISCLLGKITISAIPRTGTRCRLPMTQIIHLSDQLDEK